MVLLLLAACVPVPWVAPPTTVDIGPALGPPSPASMYEPDDGMRRTSGTPVAIYPRVVATARPLALVEELDQRRYDPWIGALVEVKDGDLVWGGTAGVDLRLWQEPWGTWRSFAGPTFALDLLADASHGDTVVPGARVGVRWEAAVWTDDSGAGFSSDGGYVGVAYGEAGLGVYADVGARLYGDGPAVQVSVGVTLQAPATAGVALVPLPIF